VSEYEDTVPAAIHAYLSQTGKKAWSKMAEDNGVSTTGLMEALGALWHEEIRANGNDADGLHVALVKAARKVDAERRRRGRR
jgi:hypothetical protein